MTPDPLTVRCSHCGAEPGQRCMMISDWARRPHAVRLKLALALAAHSDPALDEFFPHHGPCLLCCVPGLGARHRVIDGIAGMLEAGEDPDVTADEHGVSREAVDAVMAWSQRWVGAWL